ncbi:Putative pentatricopeptide repeat-containing protein At1g69350, mitochondrial [Linum grandiflorum]
MTLYMPLFRASTTPRLLKQLHAHLFITGLHHDPQASTKLIESYSQTSSLHSAALVFKHFPHPDSFMWGVILKCHVWSHQYQPAVSLYHDMLCSGIPMGGFVFPSVLRACARFGDVGVGMRVHGSVIKLGFASDPVTETSLLNLYGELGCLEDARKVFDEMPVKDVVSWSSIVSSYVDNGQAEEGLEMFRLKSSGVEIDSVTMLTIAEACGQIGCLKLARSVHGHVARKWIRISGSLRDCLVVMYSRCGDLFSAERIFRSSDSNSVISRTAMIHCYNKQGWFEQAVKVFRDETEPNVVTIIGVLSSLSGLDRLREGKSVHCYAVFKKGLNFDEEDSLGPGLVGFYAECNQLAYSERVLHKIGRRNLISWNVLISAYVQRRLLNEAFGLVLQMQRELELMPDSFTLSSALSACADSGELQLGCQVHGSCIKRRISDEFIQNALIDMYSKSGCIESAYLVFDTVKSKSVITWNSMITGFSQNGNSIKAISLFDQMFLNCLEMNEVTFLAAIQACSDMGHLDKGQWLHHKLVVFGARNDLYTDTALADMYFKCGDLRTAQRVFDAMSERSVVTWSIMISGYGMHGHIDAAISLFDQMSVKPNEITFMNILSACSHSGYVEQGKDYFNLMKNYGIEPKSEHYACMVDLLSRAGDVEGAYGLIKSMQGRPDASIWAALINGCRIHRRIDMIHDIETDLLEVSTDDTGYYALLSNVYAEEGNWQGFGKVRSEMERLGLKKVPGYSTIELDNRVYRFGAGDTHHWRTEELCGLLEKFERCAEGFDVVSVSGNEVCMSPEKKNVVLNDEKVVVGYGTETRSLCLSNII